MHVLFFSKKKKKIPPSAVPWAYPWTLDKNAIPQILDSECPLFDIHMNYFIKLCIILCVLFFLPLLVIKFLMSTILHKMPMEVNLTHESSNMELGLPSSSSTYIFTERVLLKEL